MPVPDYQTMMLPVLKLFAEKPKSVRECLPALKQELGISDEEAEERLPSGTKTLLADRAHWARTYLSKAGLLESPKRNQHVITTQGRQFLATNPDRIDVKLLAQFDGFDDWRLASRTHEHGTTPPPGTVIGQPIGLTDLPTPEDAMAAAQAILDAALSDDILSILKDITPVRFERLILDLLSAMGYGHGDLANTRMTRTTGDGGIDGIIHEDALGLDAVFIQAKRYAPEIKVGRPAIQQFIGSLTGEGASKGVFVTTSDFSAEAKGYLARVQQRVVLINGADLALLMIRYEVGVRARTTYVIKTVDEDYFADLTAG